MAVIQDRIEAGERLAERLRHLDYAAQRGTLVLALPRGGVPVGYAIARELDLPLDVLPVRKVGVPGQPELAMGAVTAGGIRYLNHALIARLGISKAAVDREIMTQERRVAEQARQFRADRPPLDVTQHNIILVDDGLATGATMQAALMYLQDQQTQRIVIAVPVAAQEALCDFTDRGIEVVCLATPEPFFGVGAHYRNFEQVADDEVRHYLERTAPAVLEQDFV